MLASNKRYKRTNINLGNDWGFYVDMDDIPAPIYITSNILYSDRSALINYINDSNENIVNINNLDSILYNDNDNNNINININNNTNDNDDYYFNNNINIVETPLTKIVTIVSTIWSSLSSLLSNIEIMDYESDNDSNSDYDD
jgi:hypothetical protein